MSAVASPSERMDDDPGSAHRRSYSHSYPHSHTNGLVKEESHDRHVARTSPNTAAATSRYYPSTKLEPPPPPPAAYSHPRHDEGEDPRKDSVISSTYPRHDPDPIPPPPAKYSYPLPSISEALDRFEARRSSQQDRSPPTPPRAPHDSHDLIIRRPSGPENPRIPMRSSLSEYVTTSNSAPGYGQLPPGRKPSSDSPRSYERKLSVEDQPPSHRGSIGAQATSHYEPYRPTYTSGPDGHYRPPYHPPAPYPGRIQTHDPIQTQAPPPPATAYTPTLYAPIGQPSIGQPSGPLNHTSAWQGAPIHEEEKKAAVARPAYGDSVKRHLDVFDLDHSLNGIADSSRELLDFSATYRNKSHQTARSGPSPGSTPKIHEVDDMMRHGSHIQESLNRLREVIFTQEAEQLERSEKAAKAVSEEPGPRQEANCKGTGSGGFAGADPKKRRGRAAPPGKCHSCNRVDTPEWRRGPDGARTLCNACGLHYAKLTRKSGTNKTGQSSSNLRPKDDSPVR